MREAGSQLSLDFGGCGSVRTLRSARKARRIASVRLVEFAPFPRVRREERWNVGFTLDLSTQGACLRAKVAEPIGSLLRVIVRGVDGRPTLDSIARVVWSADGKFGEVRMGLSLLASRSQKPRRAPARKSASPRDRRTGSARAPSTRAGARPDPALASSSAVRLGPAAA